MDTPATLPLPGTGSRASWIAGAVWIASYFGARFALDSWPPGTPWDIAVVSVPLFAFYWFVWTVQRTLRSADELRRRIHLESLAVAFLVVVIATMSLGLLEESPRGVLWLPWRNLWFALPPLYGVCFLVVSRHYR